MAYRKTLLRLLPVAVVGAGMLCVVDAIFPGASFYRAEFEKVAGIPFPPSGDFRFKWATYPDFRGDYEACALFSVSADDFEHLVPLFKEWNALSAGMSSECLKRAEAVMGSELSFRHRLITSPAPDAYAEWGLLSDGRTIFFRFAET